MMPKTVIALKTWITSSQLVMESKAVFVFVASNVFTSCMSVITSTSVFKNAYT